VKGDECLAVIAAGRRRPGVLACYVCLETQRHAAIQVRRFFSELRGAALSVEPCHVPSDKRAANDFWTVKSYG
jgi:hypothetical protein